MRNKIISSLFVSLAFSLTALGDEALTSTNAALLQKPATAEQAAAQARSLMEAMTPAERLDFVCGNGFGIRAIPRLGIPKLNFGDASCGLRLTTNELAKGKTTAFPCTLLLAATWDSSLAEEYGKSVAEEFRAADRHFILGPGMNLYRTSKDGRNFEFLGEDPCLASEIVAAYVKGAQNLNVGTTLKHFIGNETENHRRAANTTIDDRTLHEIYMPPFKAGIDAGAWAVMTAYNPLNGAWCGENKFVGTELLRHQLGFKNIIMTDWASTWYGDKVVSSGTDLDEPEGYALKLDRDKILGSPDIDRMVVNVLKTGIASGIYELESKGEFQKPEWLSKYPEHEAFSQKVNSEGIVLLANNGLLPIESQPKGKILVTGNAAQQLEIAGGGSGHVVGYNQSTFLQAVEKTFGSSNVVYVEGPSDNDIHSANMILIFTGRPYNLKAGHEGEASNHPFELLDDALIKRCCMLNPHTVVNLVCGGGAQMDWAPHAAAIVMASYGGQTGPDALMDVLTGKTNPSGKLPFTIERSFSDSCAAGDDALVKPASILAEPKDLAVRVRGTKRTDFLTNNFDDGYYTYDLNYKEGIFVGYRWYDAKNIKPRYPFGFGLSYTKFKYADLGVRVESKTPEPWLTLHFKVTNAGKRAGDEIAQVYLEFPESNVPQPKRQLKSFARVHLEPGETKEVTLQLRAEAFAFWHPVQQTWVNEPGTFKIDVGASSRDIKLSKSVKL